MPRRGFGRRAGRERAGGRAIQHRGHPGRGRPGREHPGALAVEHAGGIGAEYRACTVVDFTLSGHVKNSLLRCGTAPTLAP
ncbi:hypothetical protein CVM52_13620 [Pseudooceanicola lipolyticus]|uniref:Uncharacterized protein n=1 Tax=Pseudooceanicola lipolyticus TaxID=2029104 RepID=A0A2M8J039_9RHOB|nr:hypothetical protein CVM52_13620 [Pseudooceanicola lipolyticus]